eukprot:1401519-Pyramimonas_sp.AAC.1
MPDIPGGRSSRHGHRRVTPVRPCSLLVDDVREQICASKFASCGCSMEKVRKGDIKVVNVGIHEMAAYASMKYVSQDGAPVHMRSTHASLRGGAT